MPVRVKAFACEFGCGRNVLTSKFKMYQHEHICFHNPARRACQTCGNFVAGVKREEPPHCSAGVENVPHFDCPKWSKLNG